EDLAYIHDAGFGSVARNAAQVLIEALRRAGSESGLVVDLGCGGGILSKAVSTAGYDVLGIDISSAMIKMARARVPRGRFRKESLLTAELPPCVAVAAVGECQNYRFDRRNSERRIFTLFRRIHEALCDRGIFILDVAEPGRVPGPGPHKTYVDGGDW